MNRDLLLTMKHIYLIGREKVRKIYLRPPTSYDSRRDSHTLLPPQKKKKKKKKGKKEKEYELKLKLITSTHLTVSDKEGP